MNLIEMPYELKLWSLILNSLLSKPPSLIIYDCASILLCSSMCWVICCVLYIVFYKLRPLDLGILELRDLSRLYMLLWWTSVSWILCWFQIISVYVWFNIFFIHILLLTPGNYETPYLFWLECLARIWMSWFVLDLTFVLQSVLYLHLQHIFWISRCHQYITCSNLEIMG